MANVELRNSVFSTKSWLYELGQEKRTSWNNADVMKHFKRMIAAMNQAKDDKDIYSIGISFCNKNNFEAQEEVIALITHIEIIATGGKINPDYIAVDWPRCLKLHELPPVDPGKQIKLFS